MCRERIKLHPKRIKAMLKWHERLAIKMEAAGEDCFRRKVGAAIGLCRLAQMCCWLSLNAVGLPDLSVLFKLLLQPWKQQK